MNAWRALPVILALAGGSALSTPVDEMTLEELQKSWLHCNRMASESLLDAGTAAICSTVHERLLQRGFGGDFRRMLAWWQQQRDAALQLQRQ